MTPTAYKDVADKRQFLTAALVLATLTSRDPELASEVALEPEKYASTVL